MIPVTPHDIAELAETRRRDPDLAMRMATEAGRQFNSHPLVPTQSGTGKDEIKETKHVKRASR